MSQDDVIAKIREGTCPPLPTAPRASQASGEARARARYQLEGTEEDDAAAPVAKPHVGLLVEMLEQWGVECKPATFPPEEPLRLGDALLQ